MHKVTNLSVLANLLRLGLAQGEDAFALLRRWRRTQNISKRVLLQRHTRDIRWDADASLPADPRDCLFMSFHYGLWYMSLAAMARASGCQRVYCLVGQIDPSYEDRMAAIARAAGIEIVLVSGGTAMLRGVRQARAEGALLFVLVDVPWGVSGEPDRRYPFCAGDIAARSGLFAFAERAGLKPQLLVADYDEAQRHTQIRHHAIQTQAECFALLQDYVQRKPWLWDRLIDVHKYSQQQTPARHLPFRLAQDFYLADTSTLGITRINRPLYEQLQAHRRLRRSDATGAHALLEQIHARTALDIHAVL